MSDVARFSLCPPLRCTFRGPGSAPTYCGELAHYERHAAGGIQDAYLCDQHRQDGDSPIGLAVVFRRVRIVACIDFAGVAWLAPFAQTEAVARLEAAVRAAGGLLDVHQVTSVIGSYSPQARPGVERRILDSLG